MPGIKNAQPRFGLEDGYLYDYVTRESHLIGVMIECPEGVWDSEKVATLILAGKPIESALNQRPSLSSDKVDQANTDFVNTINAGTAPAAEAAASVVEDVAAPAAEEVHAE
jgi:hypothetical protein